MNCPACQADVLPTAEGFCPQCGEPLYGTAELDPDRGASDSAQATLVSEDFSGIIESSGAQTMQLDDSEPPASSPTAQTSPDVAESVGATYAEAESGSQVTSDRTIVAADDDLSDRTIVGESADALVDPADRTIAALPAGQDELKTLQSNWGDSEGDRPQMTIKSRGETGADSGLVGDTLSAVPRRSLRNLSEGQPGETPQLAEYELLKVLGEGGMGVVWSARQTSVDRHVAVKMIKGPLAEKRSQRQKFLTEAVVTGDLDHPNIVPIYDVGTDAVGTLFYSMKQVRGTPWLKVIRQRNLQENLEILLRVADAVSFAHSRGIIHRDLKPENVMLGEYGEVLVMDWGLALATGELEKARALRQSMTMGGTPAYMAPEMATGPMDRIGPHSDLYLLGAILWEIITGKPPHPGKKVQETLLAAIRNVITPAPRHSELVDIALKAMATRPEDRYLTVREFQQAIRDSFSHSESVAMAGRARKDLELARRTDKYTDYAKAVFGFEEALELWDGNQDAQDGIDAARLAYASSAFSKGDYDLGATLLRSDHPQHQALLKQIQDAARERNARQARLKMAKRVMTGLGVLLFVVVTTAFLWIRRERNFALEQKQIAVQQQQIAVEQKQIAVEQQQIAVEQQQIAVEQKQIAVEERDRAEAAKRQALAAEATAVAAREQEAVARQSAEQAKLDEEYEAYIARIGLAAAKIDENAFNVAISLLNECPENLRNWEWGRLMHLCLQASETFTADGPVDSVAISPDGTRLAAASWDRRARVWDLKSGKLLREFPQQGLYVYAVAWSPDQQVLATAGNDPQGLIRFWNAETGEELAHVNGHQDAVVSVHFSPDGNTLVSTSYDQTARLWDVRNVRAPREICLLNGHSWWVWDAAFHPDFQLAPGKGPAQLVTVGHDGKAIVWNIIAGPQGVTASPSTVFTGHDDPVYSVDYAPDGKSVATGGADKRILIWNPEEVPPVSLQQLLAGEKPKLKFRELLGHTAPVESVAYSADGEMLVSGSRDNAVRAWSTLTGKSLKTFRGHHNAVRSVAVTPDGRGIVSGSQDQRAIFWTIDDYEEIRVLDGRRMAGHEDAILNASFSRDGQRILTASRDRTARTWEAATGRLLQTFSEGHDYLASQGLFFPDGRTLVTSAADNSVRLWNVAAGTEFLNLQQTGRTAALALSADARWLATGSDSDEALLWNVSDLMEFSGDPTDTRPADRRPSSRPVAGHHARVTAVSFSPRENQLLTCDANGRCQLLNADENRPLWNVRHHTRRVNACRFTPDGKQILTASSDHTVSRIDTATGEELAGLILKHTGPVTALDLSADGSLILTVESLDEGQETTGARVRLWNTLTGQLQEAFEVTGFGINTISFVPHARTIAAVCTDNTIRMLPLSVPADQRRAVDPWLNFQQLGGLVWSVSFSADGRTALTVGGNEARLWDVPSRREKLSFSPHGAVASADFSPDGREVITGSWDNSAKIWNSETAQAIRRLANGHRGYLNSVAYAPDGQTVLTASDDGTAKLWDVRSGDILKVFSGHQGRVRQARFSPDGTRIVTVGSDRTARLWDAATAQPIGKPLTGHRWTLLCAAFSPDGTRILTGSEDSDARIWDVQTGECISVLEGHTAAVTSVAFSADGRRAFTASQDNSAKLWDATPGHEGVEILTLTGHSQELTSISVSPDGREILTASRDGTAVLWMTTAWKHVPPVATGRERFPGGRK